MKVILKEDIDGLGAIGTVVDVANGYGRNYLLPRELALEANPKNIKYFEHQKKNILAKAKKVKGAAEDVAAKVSALTLRFEVKAGEDDKLFGSVTSKDIADAIATQGREVDRKKILLDEPIKRLGGYDVSVKLYQDVTASVRIEVNKTASEEA
jgi:large subunit ribosomal protein L9